MPAPPQTSARPLEPLNKLIHLLVVVLGWVGFAWMWVLVSARPWESERLMWLIVGSLVVVPLLTAAWVAHNSSIHRRKGERQAVAAADQSYEHDWHGRSVQADWATLRRSRMVLVSVDGQHKIFCGSRIDAPADSTRTAETRRDRPAEDPGGGHPVPVAQD
jgi:hypothetical protein